MSPAVSPEAGLLAYFERTVLSCVAEQKKRDRPFVMCRKNRESGI